MFDDKTDLTPKERDLLAYLRQHAGKCVPREQLLQEVWGYREGVKSRTLDVHVQRLRRKLGPAEGSRLLTVFRGGYLWASGPNGGRRLFAADAPVDGMVSSRTEARREQIPSCPDSGPAAGAGFGSGGG